MSAVKSFTITPVTQDIDTALQHKIDQKTKPLGALGKLEQIALRIGQIQQSLEPRLTKPTVLVFAGDHGITAEGVSPFPQEVTQQMVLNFLAGGAAINVFARQHQMDLSVIDAGVNGDLPDHPRLLKRKVARGTRNFRREPAMTPAQCVEAIAQGAAVVQDIRQNGCNVLICGEMGIGNTSAAAVLLSVLGNLPIEMCVGRGAGLNDAKLAQKTRVLGEALQQHHLAPDPLTALTTFGGLEIAMICGAYLQAAAAKMVILIDGFISTAALLVAAKMYPAVTDYCFFGHASEEPGHRLMLELLGAEVLLPLKMRLGEGTGAAVAYPLLVSAVNFLNEMASFESAGVSSAQ